ncbi:MAG: amino acid permease [Candidatus Diapherotrites archaeon]|nr:amino acid permease [Candidatus Diapherotrites archaeon]
MPFKEKLGLFDTTNLVIGAVIGSDIYVATYFGMNQLGPSSILVWIVAGIFAIITALAFAQCARSVKKVGGPYAFVKQAFGHFPAFISGWLLWLAELAGLCVFPLAFVTYLQFFIPLDFIARTAVIGLFICFLFFTNYFGIKKAAHTNDIFTIVKLFPLLLIMLLGLFLVFFRPSQVFANFMPFMPFGFSGFGESLVLIFWAFVGFEIATIPAGEIRNPGKTIPKAIMIGMIIVTVFYLLTNLSLIAIAGMQLAEHDAPLAFAASLMLGSIGALVIAVGALVSVSGSDESNLIGTVRLGYALAADGYFPKQMAKLHPKYASPYVSLIVHSILAFILTAFFSIKQFIIFSTFNFALVYLLVTFSAFRIGGAKNLFEKAVLYASSLICLYLLANIGINEFLAGIACIAFAVVIYPFFSKQELKDEKKFFFREEHVLYRMVRHEESFLANAFKHFKILARKLLGLKHAHSLRERPHSHSGRKFAVKF